MKNMLPINLRKPEHRHAARALADSILRADRHRQRRAELPQPDKKKAPLVEAGPRRLHLSDLKSALAAKRRLHRAKAERANPARLICNVELSDDYNF